MEQKFIDIQENIKVIRERINEAAVRSGRSENDVRFMAVTKTVDPVYINHAIDCGIDLIGENKVQEFLGKKDALKLENVEKHLIGHLQSNKVRKIITEVDMIQSVDSVSLAKEIERLRSLGFETSELIFTNAKGNQVSIYLKSLM